MNNNAIIELQKSKFSLSIALEGLHYKVVPVMFNRSSKLLQSEGNLAFSKAAYYKWNYEKSGKKLHACFVGEGIMVCAGLLLGDLERSVAWKSG